MLTSTYSPVLVACSLLVAILAAYTALDMAGRISTAQGRAAHGWLAAGACAMGLGIWSMHFVGMLAFSLPIALGYDPAITLLSLLIAIASSGFALWLVCQQTLPWPRLIAGALLMGPAIAGMHYTGMAAMRMTPEIVYAPPLFALSIVIAVAASGAALWMAFQLRRHSQRIRLLRIGAAVVMGIAIAGMHYTGMAAAGFRQGTVCGAARDGMNNGWLAVVVIIVTLAVLAIALIISLLDMRMDFRTSGLKTSLAQANQELTYLTLHDSLTRLPNRILLEDRLAQAVHGADRSNGSFALLFMDLDRFRSINDVFGHHVGDQLLVEVARRIVEKIRREETFARLGADEFGLLARIDDPADAAAVADMLVKALEEPFQLSGRELGVSASVGIAVYPGNGAQPRDLLTNAIAATNYAKALGRSGYCFFEISMNAHVHEQMQLVQDLRLAVPRGELVLHYQPKFNAPSGPITGVEALLRWMHPTRGLIAPDEFVPLAEKNGLIVTIGEWVLDEACRQMRAWRDAGHTAWTVAVNLSPRQFGHANLTRSVRAALDRHALEPHCLTLEITESTAMHDVESSLAVLSQLHRMGVSISIDDFGTGYSSLLYLKRLPASELKIDRGFVHDLDPGSEDVAIVSAIVALGRALKLRIVAEGVETIDQQSLLTELGCDTLQGYLLGRPMTAEDLIAVVTAQATQ
jgi:diguanylate cyclase